MRLSVPEQEPNSVSTPLAAEALFDAVYQRLKAMAGHQLAGRARDTLNTTALVHELYLRLSKHDELKFEHPGQFFAYAARAMRNLLANRARDRASRRFSATCSNDKPAK